MLTEIPYIPNEAFIEGNLVSESPSGFQEWVLSFSLELKDNKIQNLKGIEVYKKLTGLNLRKNQIESIQYLEDLIWLKDLDLSKNRILKIQGLKNQKNLFSLDLSYNKIEKLEGLENCTKLMKLKLSGNPIRTELLEEVGGLDENGFANKPQKFVKYCH